MKEFLCKLESDPESSALGALLSQRERLTAHTSHESPAVKENTALLSSFEVCSMELLIWAALFDTMCSMFFQVFKSLSVSSNHLELLRNFPQNFRFIVLQHSPDK